MPATNSPSAPATQTVAEIVARFLVARGVDRIFGLQGGHIQPIWDQLAQLGVRIVDVRDEGAAVHMAHAHAALGGGVGVAMATAGPGVTNCVTAMTHAHLERVPVLLIGGCPPTLQEDLGPLQGIDHAAIMAPVTRQSRTLRVAEQVARDLDKAWAMAEGDGNPPGPVYIEIPTDVLRQQVSPASVLPEHLVAKPKRRLMPDPVQVARAAQCLREAARLAPKDARVQGNLAAMYFLQQRFQPAIAAARVAIEVDPKYPAPYAVLGMALKYTGDIPGARAVWTEGARLNPKMFEPLLRGLPPLPLAPLPREVKPR